PRNEHDIMAGLPAIDLLTTIAVQGNEKTIAILSGEVLALVDHHVYRGGAFGLERKNWRHNIARGLLLAISTIFRGHKLHFTHAVVIAVRPAEISALG